MQFSEWAKCEYGTGSDNNKEVDSSVVIFDDVVKKTKKRLSTLVYTCVVDTLVGNNTMRRHKNMYKTTLTIDSSTVKNCPSNESIFRLIQLRIIICLIITFFFGHIRRTGRIIQGTRCYSKEKNWRRSWEREKAIDKKKMGQRRKPIEMWKFCSLLVGVFL